MAPFGPAAGDGVEADLAQRLRLAAESSRAAATAAISSSRPCGASRSSQARKRTTAAPSRLWAARAPLISAVFLRALGAGKDRARARSCLAAAESLRKNPSCACPGRAGCACRMPFSAVSRRVERRRVADFASGARCALASGSIFAGVDEQSGLPLRARWRRPAPRGCARRRCRGC